MSMIPLSRFIASIESSGFEFALILPIPSPWMSRVPNHVSNRISNCFSSGTAFEALVSSQTGNLCDAGRRQHEGRRGERNIMRGSFFGRSAASSCTIY